MARPRQRVRLKDGLKLDLNLLVRQKLVRPGAASETTIFWRCRYSGDVVATGGLSADMTGDLRGWLRLQLGTLDQSINLEARPRHYGGRQWYFTCPYTGRRASTLWKPPGARQFACRQAWGRQVAYGSQFERPRDRALSAAQDLRFALGGKTFLCIDDFMPPKPKWMRWRTYEAVTGRCEAHEAVCHRYLAGLLARLKKIG